MSRLPRRGALPILAALAAFGFMVLGGARVSSAAVVAAVVLAGAAAVTVRNARRHARQDFLASYTGSRGLELEEYRELAQVTPLLRMGDRRYAEQVMTGVLPGGVRGLLAFYAYESKRGGEDVNRMQIHRFTVVLHWLPNLVDRIDELHCVPRGDPSAAGMDASLASTRLQLESVALDRRYEISFGPDEDPRWLRRLFSPSFIVGLCEQEAPGFGFQLANGHLCVFAAGHRESAADLDALCEAAAFVGTRLAQEAAGA